MLGLAVLLGASVGAAETVEIVVDGSGGGWRLGSDQRPLADATRRLLLDLAGRLAARETAPAVRLRWIGGTPGGAVDGCLAVDDVAALNPANLAGLAADIDGRVPAGQRPLVRAIEAARAGDADRIVVLTTGPDSCGGQLADIKLGADPTTPIEIVSLEVRPTALGTLPDGIRNRVVVLGVSGADALAEAVLPDEGKGPRDAAIEVVSGDGTTLGDEVSGSAVQTVSGESFELFRRRDGRLVARVPAGPYLVRIGLAGATLEISDIVAASGAEARIAITTPPHLDLEPLLDSTFDMAAAISELMVRVWGNHEQPVWLSVVKVDSPVDMVATATVLPAGARDAIVMVPDIAGPCELRAHVVDPAGHRILAARYPLLIRPPQATLEVAARSEIETPLSIAVSGPGFPGDAVAIAAVADAATESAVCRRAGDQDRTVELPTPATPGAFEVRYLSGLTGRILARAPLEVYEVLARLRAPAEVAAGAPFEVAWEGPAAPGDFLTIVAPTAPEGQYHELALVAAGTPVTMRAPAASGTWEVRYVDGASAATFGRTPFAVTAPPPLLDAPAVVAAGARFQVDWTGPNQRGDFITIAPADAPSRRHEDFAFTSLGSPASLAAPFEPGEYELRYFDGASGELLAQRPLSVR